MTAPRPSVGRIVHLNVHVEPGVEPRPLAAMITSVIPLAYPGAPQRVTLTLFPVGAEPYASKHSHQKGTAPGTWCWPPMVPLAQTPR